MVIMIKKILTLLRYVIPRNPWIILTNIIIQLLFVTDIKKLLTSTRDKCKKIVDEVYLD